ncbi:Polyribonucleotide 5'-Hydroxyl-Kinase Clp1 [Manis pentadactyla]|nr:Polyribonucleotide 5'-Hydroxyl-Kinase Clp1 [Manis pentadactyla]
MSASLLLWEEEEKEEEEEAEAEAGEEEEKGAGKGWSCRRLQSVTVRLGARPRIEESTAWKFCQVIWRDGHLPDIFYRGIG